MKLSKIISIMIMGIMVLNILSISGSAVDVSGTKFNYGIHPEQRIVYKVNETNYMTFDNFDGSILYSTSNISASNYYEMDIIKTIVKSENSCSLNYDILYNITNNPTSYKHKSGYADWVYEDFVIRKYGNYTIDKSLSGILKPQFYYPKDVMVSDVLTSDFVNAFPVSVYGESFDYILLLIDGFKEMINQSSIDTNTFTNQSNDKSGWLSNIYRFSGENSSLNLALNITATTNANLTLTNDHIANLFNVTIDYTMQLNSTVSNQYLLMRIGMSKEAIKVYDSQEESDKILWIVGGIAIISGGFIIFAVSYLNTKEQCRTNPSLDNWVCRRSKKIQD